jgi:acyl-CoA thioesterase-1
MLDHIAGHSELMQQDGIHPDTKAQPQVMKNVWSGLKMILDKESPGKPR